MKPFVSHALTFLLCSSSICWADRSNVSFPLFIDEGIEGNALWTPTPIVVWHELEQKYFGCELVLQDSSDVYRGIRDNTLGADLYPENSFNVIVQYYVGSSSDDPKDAKEFSAWEICCRNEELLEIRTEASMKFNASFDLPFIPLPITFTNSKGISGKINGFGLNNETNLAVRGQAEILYYDSEKNFAVSLKTSDPSNALVVALLNEAPDSLKFGYDYVGKRIEQDRPARFREIDKLFIPELRFQYKNHYDALEGETVTVGSGHSFIVDESSLDIRMQLTRFGVELESNYLLRMKIGLVPEPPKICYVGSPFMVYMKRQDSEVPYFIAWIDDVEAFNNTEPRANHGTRPSPE